MNEKDRQWRRSSYSTNGNCVETASAGQGRIKVRDSKNADGPHLVLGKEAWISFTSMLKA
ncbi:DUF397 domain-containing protein [Sphaerisporangium sp. TRM90804]|uniref:DUF397 domain-containing protein n=1 Tax=Sphaerisporangium sp. TRM90804 TaxID=3031113 RepID=UPI0024482AD3|nr:DUF397 domain-containing protein [Sphaerisporangium sp. TRM90804]MDH2426751.1 DUF397 domain-containing protein [Sphaerisporangium sp. TRM90804]